MKKIFFTGGTGFFGKAMLKHWRRKHEAGKLNDVSITILSRRPEIFDKNNRDILDGMNIKLISGDIMLPDTFPKLEVFTHIIHAATDSTIGPQLTPLNRFDQIVKGTRNILDYASRCGAKRFLFTSSGGVYGPQPRALEKIPEDYFGIPDPMKQEHAYSIGKRTAEHLCSLYSEQFEFDVVIARCFAFIGEDLPLDVHFAIGNFIKDALFAEQIVVNGDGTPVRTYLYQDDLAEWLEVLLDEGVDRNTYNVGSDTEITIAELANLVRKIASPNKKVVMNSLKDTGNIRNRYVPSIEKIKKMHGVDIKVNLESAIYKTVKRLKKQL